MVVQRMDSGHGGVNWDSVENEDFISRTSNSFLTEVEKGVAYEER